MDSLPENLQDGKALTQAAAMMRLLSNPHRLAILCHLGETETSVNDLAELVQMQPSALSQHLAKMKKAGLVTTRREHNRIFYRLASEETARITGLLKDLYCGRE
jgi:ArsR family transcriptional regulator